MPSVSSTLNEPTIRPVEPAKIFGDPNAFAIQYSPESTPKTTPENTPEPHDAKIAFCHLIIGGTLIGNPGEACYLPTWFAFLTGNREKIAASHHSPFPKEFYQLSDREIFETINRATQFEEEFNPDFLYLPKPDEDVWANHSFSFDETLDSYFVYFYVRDDQLTFLIRNWREHPDDKNTGFLFHTFPLDQFFQAVDDFSLFLLEHYPYLQKTP